MMMMLMMMIHQLLFLVYFLPHCSVTVEISNCNVCHSPTGPGQIQEVLKLIRDRMC